MSHTGKVLIVDDDEHARDLLADLLDASGHHLTTARNGAEALKRASEFVPDIILLDVMMPEMDGFEVCRHLRQHSHLAEVPIILVTALDDRQSRIRGLQAGADDFISKPVDLVELRARVQTIIRLNRYHRLLIERARFTRLIELSPDGILIVSNNGTILLANPAMVRMLHASSEEVVTTQTLRDIAAPDQLDYCQTCMASVIADPGRVVRIETMLWRLDGTTVPVELNVGYFDWEEQDTVQMIARDITERKQATEELQRTHRELADHKQRLQHLVEKLLASQEEERRRIAYELHDGLAQVASGAYQHLQTFASLYRPRDEKRRHVFNQALELTRRVVQEARQVIGGLRPTVLDDFGLVSALGLELEPLRQDGWDIIYEVSVESERLPSVVETTLFRVAQEALTNIRKHAQTKRARLALHSQNQTIRLEVQDWGNGFDIAHISPASKPGECIGLIGMQERITLLGGKLNIQSHIGSGTRIIAEVPLSQLLHAEGSYHE